MWVMEGGWSEFEVYVNVGESWFHGRNGKRMGVMDAIEACHRRTGVESHRYGVVCIDVMVADV